MSKFSKAFIRIMEDAVKDEDVTRGLGSSILGFIMEWSERHEQKPRLPEIIGGVEWFKYWFIKDQGKDEDDE